MEKAIRTPWFIGLLLVAATLLVYGPVVRHDFINFDDPEFVTANTQVQRGLTWEGVAWAFRPGHGDYWHPLTWLSHMLDVQLFGKSSAGPHGVNVLFHAANAMLLFLLLRRLTGAHGKSALVAALFALHPLRVESVAWISERKDVLSTLFALLSLWAYARYAQKGRAGSPLPAAGAGTGGAHLPRQCASTAGGVTRPTIEIEARASRYFYWLALLFFALGLMGKAMLVTLPFVMLLLDYWPLRRIERITNHESRITILRLLGEKIPFLLLSAGACLMTYLTAKTAVAAIVGLPVETRMETAAVAYVWYLGKAIWPAGLAPMYPHPGQWPMLWVALSGVVLAGLSLGAVFQARKRPYIFTGWCWYWGTLVPVIGLVQVGVQWVADRFTYVPLIGVFIVLVWGAAETFAHWRLPRAAMVLVAGLVLAACALRTSNQLGHWQSSTSLFTHALKVTTENHLAHNNLGSALAAEGKLEEAKVHYLAALRSNPSYAGAAYNLGVLCALQERPAEAMEYLAQTIRLDPRFAAAHCKLAQLLAAQKRFDEAIASYHHGLELQPDLVEALNNLAWILAANPDARLRDGREAVRLAERACDLTKNQTPLFIGTLAAAYAEAGRFEDAVATGERARALALAAGQMELANRNTHLLELYRTNRAYREADTMRINRSDVTSPPVDGGASRNDGIQLPEW
jgi:tetratricopeptide (TPR) repeat protein